MSDMSLIEMDRDRFMDALAVAQGECRAHNPVRAARYIGAALALTSQSDSARNPDLAIRAALITAFWSLEDGRVRGCKKAYGLIGDALVEAAKVYEGIGD